jgi:hypothetical protein
MHFTEIAGAIGSAVFSSHRILLPLKEGKKILLLPYNVDPESYFSAHGYKFQSHDTLPFYLVDGLIVLKGRIKKSPESMNIMIDTGAETTMVSVAAAKKYAYINYPLSSQLRSISPPTVAGVGGRAQNFLVAENVEVGIGGLKKEYNRMLAANLADSSEGVELELDVILGRDFLSGYTLLIDYKNRQITFYR